MMGIPVIIWFFASQAPADHDAVIARTREAALAYGDRLQDFLCVQTTDRSVDAAGTGKHWKHLETREVEVAYVAHQEKSRLLSVKGKSMNPEKGIKKGYFTPGGEFGRSLEKIFDPKARATFTWDHEEMQDGRPVCVFRYEVPRASTTMGMTADLDKVFLAHHGVVYADCGSGSVLRFQIAAEPGILRRNGKDIAIGVDLEVRYAPATIGEKEFLMPASADEVVTFGSTKTRAEITFGRYRKYEASSTIRFEDPPKP
jgi:hypothetical protein